MRKKEANRARERERDREGEKKTKKMKRDEGGQGRIGGNVFRIVGALYLPINSELPSLCLVGAEKLAEALIVLRNLVSDVCTWQFEGKILSPFLSPSLPLLSGYPSPLGETIISE